MRTKEYFYEYNFLAEIIASSTYQAQKKDWADRIYRFLLKHYYRAKKTAIDYCNKVVYLQFDHHAEIEDERIATAQSRVVELHYPNLKTLLGGIFKRRPLPGLR